ncbi:hypothetical protein BDB01DRAFT_801073 [Pilobolus umbonatus]|nr:hypothetical protein BDB01DRAFT_801073 [Pilobolus umbonatus]
MIAVIFPMADLFTLQCISIHINTHTDTYIDVHIHINLYSIPFHPRRWIFQIRKYEGD